jgi:hypothetical protein
MRSVAAGGGWTSPKNANPLTGTEGSNPSPSSGESVANSVRALRALLDQGEAADQAATRSARMCQRQAPGRRYSS